MAKKNKYYVRPDGIHEAIRTINGKRVAFRGKTDREVDRKILEYREEAKKGRKAGIIADEWEREHESQVSESTRLVYSYAVKRFKAQWGEILASKIKPLDVKRYIVAFEKEGRSANSVQTELSVCKMIFSYAVLAGDIDVNPATEVKKSRGLPVKHRTALTEDQEEQVRNAARHRIGDHWLFGYFLMYTGCRRGEALALSYSDIDRKAGVIHVDKKLSYATGQFPTLEDHLKSANGKRDIPLLQPLADVLPKGRVGLIFPGKDGGFMRASDIRSIWRQYCRDTGLSEVQYATDGTTRIIYPVTPHCFRHSFATICYEAGIDPRQAAEIFGDTPEVLEGVYTHLRDAHQKTAAEKLEKYVAKKESTGE